MRICLEQKTLEGFLQSFEILRNRPQDNFLFSYEGDNSGVENGDDKICWKVQENLILCFNNLLAQSWTAKTQFRSKQSKL